MLGSGQQCANKVPPPHALCSVVQAVVVLLEDDVTTAPPSSLTHAFYTAVVTLTLGVLGRWAYKEEGVRARRCAERG